MIAKTPEYEEVGRLLKEAIQLMEDADLEGASKALKEAGGILQNRGAESRELSTGKGRRRTVKTRARRRT